jgi:hypothetical protein
MSSDGTSIGLPRSIPHFREVGELTEEELSRFTQIQKRRVTTMNEVDRRLDWLLRSVDTCKGAHSGKPFEQALDELTNALIEYRTALEAPEEDAEAPAAEPDERPARARAITAGRRRNQVSIWDNAAEVAIPTGGTGEFRQIDEDP